MPRSGARRTGPPSLRPCRERAKKGSQTYPLKALEGPQQIIQSDFPRGVPHGTSLQVRPACFVQPTPEEGEGCTRQTRFPTTKSLSARATTGHAEGADWEGTAVGFLCRRWWRPRPPAADLPARSAQQLNGWALPDAHRASPGVANGYLPRVLQVLGAPPPKGGATFNSETQRVPPCQI